MFLAGILGLIITTFLALIIWAGVEVAPSMWESVIYALHQGGTWFVVGILVFGFVAGVVVYFIIAVREGEKILREEESRSRR